MTQPFAETIKRAMEPLADRFGLHVKQESENTMVADVLYANDTTAVRVTVDWGEFRPFVSLYRLEVGELPLPAAVALPSNEQLRDFDADTLLKLRAKGDSPAGKMFSERSPEGAFPLLRAYATALEEHASDVLRGDFAVFPALEREVRKRYNARS